MWWCFSKSFKYVQIYHFVIVLWTKIKKNIAEKECQHFINPKCVYEATEHTDIVRNIICHESRVYSAG